MDSKLTDAQFEDRTLYTIGSVDGLEPEDQLQVLTVALINVAELHGFRPSTTVARFAAIVEGVADEPGRFKGPFNDAPKPEGPHLTLKDQMQATVHRAVERLTNTFNALEGDTSVRMSAILNVFTLSVIDTGMPDEECLDAVRAALKHNRAKLSRSAAGTSRN